MSSNDFNRAFERYKNGEFDGTLALLKPMLLDNEKRSQVLALMAACFQKKGDNNLSRLFILRAIEIEPDNDSYAKIKAGSERALEENSKAAESLPGGRRQFLFSFVFLLIAGLLGSLLFFEPISDMLDILTDFDIHDESTNPAKNHLAFLQI